MGDRQTDVVRRHAPNRRGEELLFNQTLGEQLRKARTRAGMTQDQLAGHVGITRSSIANIERGQQTPGLYRLMLLCSSLSCELSDVLPNLDFPAADIAGSLDDRYTSLVRRVQAKASKVNGSKDSA